MPPTPSTSRRKSHGHVPDTPADLKDRALLVPRDVFPKERVPKGFPGWEAKVVGADRVREDCLHVFVRFDGYDEQYHFPASLVRTWVVGGSEEEEEEEVRPPPRKSPRKAAATSSRTPAASRRRSSAAAKAAQVEQQQQADDQEEMEEVMEEAATAPSPAKSVAKPAAQPGALRKRKAAEAAGGTAAAEEQQQHEAVAEPGLLERATEAVKQTSLAVAATGVCYGLLRALYPLEGGV